MSERKLPIYEEQLTSEALRPDGRRPAIQPADVHGRFQNVRKVVLTLLIAFWAALPWIPIGGHPAVFINIERRTLYLFGGSFNAQDTALLFFLVTGLGFGIFYTTTLLGRSWCGWACPQTVFIEGLYRRVERLIEGPREQRLHRNAGPWTLDKVARKGATWSLYVVFSVLLAHIVLAYFVSLPRAFEMVQKSPSAHPEAFAWVVGLSLLFFVNFAWFREQFCVVLCPYGRLQSVLTDDHSLVVGYDAKRGEPRGKKGTEGAGACVDCKRCIVVCPTGIDIRKGTQLECIGCTACIDACDDVMDRLERPRGLIRYDSREGFKGHPRKIFRPRVIFYTALLAIGAVVASVFVHSRTDFAVNFLRLQGAPYVLAGDDVRDSYQLHIVSKVAEPKTFIIEVEPSPDMQIVLPMTTVTLTPMGQSKVPLFLSVKRSAFRGDFKVHVTVRREDKPSDKIETTAMFIGPG